jgi:hypothetical protein
MELTFALCQLIHDTGDRSHSSPSFPSRSLRGRIS